MYNTQIRLKVHSCNFKYKCNKNHIKELKKQAQFKVALSSPPKLCCKALCTNRIYKISDKHHCSVKIISVLTSEQDLQNSRRQKFKAS